MLLRVILRKWPWFFRNLTFIAKHISLMNYFSQLHSLKHDFTWYTFFPQLLNVKCICTEVTMFLLPFKVKSCLIL